MTLALIVLLPLLGALLPSRLERHSRSVSAWGAAVVAGLAALLLLSQTPAVLAGQVLVAGWPWLPAAGLALAFRLDGLGLLFAGLVLGIGLLVILYARYYLSPRDPMGRFYAFLLLFMGAMLGVVLAENLLLLVVFWELTSLSSFLLIGYWKHQQQARQGARLALTVTAAGGLCLLAGVLLLGRIAGSFELSTVLASGARIQADPRYPAALVLILLGAFTKSAQFPFHFWLPHAMAAPTPVSAYLHSATMVKAGVFLLARLYPALAGTELWFWLVAGTGLATLLLSAAVALFKHDLKGLLAYSTTSHLGLITLLFGLGTPLGAVAGTFHIINHATFKASLFMAAGIIDHEAGTRDMRRLAGLWRFMPQTAALAMVAAAAMAGVPLLNGFLSKEMFFAETVDFTARLGLLGWLLPALATLAGVFSVAYSLRFIHDVFFNGEPHGLPRTPHEPPAWMKLPIGILVALCLAVGTVPALTVAPLLAIAAGAVLGGELPAYSLAIWHGVNAPLLMSLTALAGGVLVYAIRAPLTRFHDSHWIRLDGRRGFERALRTLSLACERLTARLENGSLPRYAAITVAAAVALGALPFVRAGGLGGPLASAPLDAATAGGALLLMLTALATTLLQRLRLLALIFAGAAGLLVALAFARFSGLDLALTQIAVEAVTLVLLLLALHLLPARAPIDTRGPRRLRDGLVATAAGIGAGGLCWAVLSRPYTSIAPYFLENAVPGGGGANAVNVILVDFRGFDTLGEITVLGIAALGIAALLEGLRLAPPACDPDGRPWSADRHPLILATIARPLLPLALLVAAFVFLRGHNLPGGGFVAALITALALVVQYLAGGLVWTDARLHLRAPALIAAGLAVAGLTGLASFAFGHPFLSSSFAHVELPLLGELELASAMGFDLGVYLTVVGVVLLILGRLGRSAQAGTETT